MSKFLVDGDEMLIQTEKGSIIYVNTKTGVTDEGPTQKSLPGIQHKPAIPVAPVKPTVLVGHKAVAEYLGMGRLGAPYISMWTAAQHIKPNKTYYGRAIGYDVVEVERFKISAIGRQLLAGFEVRYTKERRK